MPRYKSEENNQTGLEIAVIGMACRFPGAQNLDEFWENLKNGVESISFFTYEELEEAGIGAEQLQDPNYVRARGFLEDIEYFDSSFFGYTPAEVEATDPQVRICHECTWHALEDAGYNPGDYNGRIGFYAGASSNFPWEANTLVSSIMNEEDIFSKSLLANNDYLSMRICYNLKLTGPGIALSSTCSTSLVAIDMACKGLLTGQCDIALAGGVTVSLPAKRGYLYREGMILSPDGHVRAFDAMAGGFTGGDGVGIVVLKQLEDAVADGDYIYAVIKGSAINNDGRRKVGFTAPSVEGQSEVIRAALRMAEVEPESIGYIETHGSATPLGDTIEIEALKHAFNTDKKGFCGIGSVKTNVGHLDRAAGAASFIKAALIIKHKQIPQSLNFKNPNPKIDLDNSPFYVVTGLTPWQNDKYPLRVGVSSFGIGGTNAHLVLEEAPEPRIKESSESARNFQLTLLSAKTQPALERMTENFIRHLKENPGLDFADAAYTMIIGRGAFKYRKMAVAVNIPGVVDILADANSWKVHEYEANEGVPPVIFIFPGLGSQYVNMGLDLYKTEAIFRDEMNHCFELIEPLLGYDIKNILYPTEISAEQPSAGISPGEPCKFNRFEITQVIVFIFEYTLTRLLMEWGIKPNAMIGYSFGEFTAACISGVFSLEDALKLIVARGKLIQTVPEGAMLSVPLSLKDLQPIIPDGLSIAIDNGLSCIAAGPVPLVKMFEKKMKEKGHLCMLLHASRAIHSEMMDPILMEFEDKLKEIKLNKPQVPFISNVTGTWISDGEAKDTAYWRRHLRETVRFSDGIKELLKREDAIFIEVGAGRDISSLLTRYIEKNPRCRVVNLTRSSEKGGSDISYLLKKIGTLWLYGLEIDWNRFYAGKNRYRVPLPGYPFERQQYSIDLKFINFNPGNLPRHITFQKKKNILDWLYIPSWSRSQAAIFTNEELPDIPTWLVFVDKNGVGDLLVKRLEEQGKTVVSVKAGTGFTKIGDTQYILNPYKAADYMALFQGMAGQKKIPGMIVHLWSLSEPRTGELTIEAFNLEQYNGFFSILYTARAIGKSNINNDIEIMVITGNMQEVTGEEYLCPEKATVLGPVKVIPQENRNIKCRCIDIVFSKQQNNQYNYREISEQLLMEFSIKSPDTIVAYRGSHRWVQTYDPITAKDEKERRIPLKEKGVYLITGGTGNIGLVLAEYLANTFQARLALVGRSTLPGKSGWALWLNSHGENDRVSRKIRKIQQLEEMGAEILVFEANVADVNQMQYVLTQTELEFGPVNGVIHAAGVIGDNLYTAVDDINPAVSETNFQPKVAGTLVIENILQARQLDFCLLMSSLSAVLGGLGFAAYAAANLFMDSFTLLHNRHSPVRWISVAWDGWTFTDGKEKAPVGAMSQQEGVDIFKRVLSWNKASQFVVSTMDIEAAINKWIKFEARTVPVETGNMMLPTHHQRPNLSTPYIPPQNPLEHEIAGIWQRFFLIESIGREDDFFELGGDSLKATTLAARMHKNLNVRIPLEEIFNNPTVKDCAQYIKNIIKEQYESIEPAEEKEYYLLSSAQKRLYILQQMNPASTAYNISQLIPLKEEYDWRRIEEIFKKLIKRHESLRTSFHIVNDTPVQVVHDEVEFKIEELGIRDQGAPFIHPFDLSRAPLLRVGLLKNSDGGYILLTDMHHIISDGVSHDVLVKDYQALYNGEEKPPLRLHYRDFSEWQNNQRERSSFKQQEAYWLKEFEGDIPVLNLPADFSRSTVRGFEGDTAAFDISREEATSLNEIARARESTLFIVLFAIFDIFLSKLTNREVLIVGTPAAGRRHADLEQIIGMFVNTLALCSNPAGDKTYINFLSEVREKTLKAFENQDYQFEDLVEKVVKTRDEGRNPLFDVMFSLQNFFSTNEAEEIEEEKKITAHHIETLPGERLTKFDLSLDAVEKDEKLHFTFEYRTKLFRKETILGFIQYFKKIISSVIEGPGKKIMELEMLSAEEKQRLLFDFNRTETDYPKDKTIHQLFVEQALEIPDRVAMHGCMIAWMDGEVGADLRVCPAPDARNVSLTYRQLNEQSDRLAGLLLEKGVLADDIVGIMMERSIDLVIGMLGILKSGGAYLPIDPEYPRERIDYMLKDSGAKILINKKFFGGSRGAVFQKSPPCIGNLAYVIYTSGSTGRPKGVIVEHRNVLRLIKNSNYIHFSSRDRLLPTGSPAFDITTFEIWGPLCNGSMMFLASKDIILNSEKLKEVLVNHDISILHLIPTLFNQMAARDIEIFAGLRCFLVGGDLVQPAYINKLREKYNHLKILHMYGPTENTTFSTFFTVDGNYQFNIPIGIPIGNSTVYILDNYGHLRPIGVMGELCVGGEGIARGYLNNPELTHEKFKHDLSLLTNHRSPIYKTGDLARWLNDGNIEFLGRIDSQVKIRGFRVELGEIENLLLKHHDIEESIVVTKEDMGTGEVHITAYIVSDKAIEIQEIREFLAGQLPHFMIPSYFVQLDKIPLTPGGKVDRKKLPEPVFMTGKEYVGPRNEIETKLVEIWAEVLGGDQLPASQLQSSIGIDDNFFHLGGHSLKATILAFRIEKTFNVKITLAEIFKNPRIREVAGYIKDAVQWEYIRVELAEKKEYYVLSSAQKRLYFLQQMDKNGITYNIPSIFVLEGIIDKDRLEQSIRGLIRRHESLRTSFVVIGEEPVQQIHEFPATDTLPQHQQKRTLSKVFGPTFFQKGGPPEAIIKSFICPFDLSKAPLLRVGLVRLTEEKHLFLVDMHHIISDGMSSLVLAQDFSTLYSGKQLPGINIQYKDYAEWQNRERVSKKIQEQGEYWKKEYEGEIPVLELPTDYERPAVQGFEGNTINFEINGETSGDLKALALGAGATLYIVLLALYNILLTKLTGREDIVIGSPVAGRRHADLEKIIGMFVNTLALRNYPTGEKKFTDFLEEVKGKTLKAFENQEYQYEDLVEAVAVTRDVSRNPLFDTMFVLRNTDMKELDIPGLKLIPHEYENKTSKFDLILFAAEAGDKLLFTVEYSTKLFREATVGRFITYFINIIEEIIENRAQRISDINFLTETEKRQILFDFNETERKYPTEKTIHELFEEQVERMPDHIAVFGPVETPIRANVHKNMPMAITYRQLNDRSNRLARLLIKKGAGPEVIVGIMIDRSLEMVVGLMAILKTGGAYLPIEPGLPQQRVLFMLNNSGARILLTDTQSVKNISFTLLQGFEESGNIHIHLTAPRPPIADFDDLPAPDRQYIDLRNYKNKIGMASVTDCISIQTTRGCPYECLYCHKIWSKKHVHRSAEKIYREIEYFYKNGVTNFAVIDDCFNLNTQESRKLFHLIIENKLKIQLFFPNGLRGDIMTPEYIDLMVEAGTRGINLSLETASPRLQKLMRKNLDLEKFKKVIDYIASHYPNVILELATMHGFPGETEEEAMMTLEFIKSVRWLHFPYIHILKIFPNTEMEYFALEQGISRADIMASKDRAFHELPETLPFPKSFTRKYQSDFLNNYFLNKERLTHVLPYQMKVLSEGALIQKYNAYLPLVIESIDDIVKFVQLDDLEIPGGYRGVVEAGKTIFGREFHLMTPKPGAKKILFLDLSQHFSSHRMLYRVVEQPLGALYLLTYLKKRFGDRIDGRIYKSGNDFDNFEELKNLVDAYSPDLVGIRTLTFFKDFFHETVSRLRQWGVSVPIITGGPYASSDYDIILKDKNIDLVVLGEGEETLSQLIERMLTNGFKLPDHGELNQIKGIAFAVDSVDSRANPGVREVIQLEQMTNLPAMRQPANLTPGISANNLAYIMYTSGSTGRPRGVMVEHHQVINCLHWMQEKFKLEPGDRVAQRTNLSFDPSVWEIFWPLAAGAAVKIIGEPRAKDAEFLLRLMGKSREVTIMYCPATLVTAMTYLLESSPVKPPLKLPLLIIGAEPIAMEVVKTFFSYFSGRIINTYGPTEGTINNTYYELRPGDQRTVVPIGKPVANNRIYILSEALHPVPVNMRGEICIAGHSVARGYISDRKRTEERFIDNPFGEGKLYKTGDMGRWLEDGNIEIMGRIDDQVKIRGYRIEPGEIENALLKHEAIEACLVVAKTGEELKEKIRECNACGIWSNYPGVTINNEGICNFCENFNRYKKLIQQYFKTPRDLELKLREKNKNKQSKYDCLLVYACERVATYALYKLVEMGFNVLTATYDPGHYDRESLDRIKALTASIGVDHVFLRHQRSDEIMKESLRVAKTMCKGCIHTSSSLAGEYAYKNNIKFVIGETLSRGQIVENKLYKFIDMGISDAAELETEIEKLQKNTAQIDKKIFDIIDIEVVTNGTIYNKVEFIDFYRYFDVTNEEMIRFLDSKDPYWKNLETTAIYSTDCKICQVGNYNHLKEKGYHYTGSAKSWDQRLGLTTRKALKEDLTIGLSAQEHAAFLDKLGYREQQSLEINRKYICAYIVMAKGQALPPLREYLSGKIPAYMIPSYFIPLTAFPLTSNGKIDRKALPKPELKVDKNYIAPGNEIEKKLVELWASVLHIEKDIIGINSNFFELGGHSLNAVQLLSTLQKDFEVSLSDIFQHQTISSLTAVLPHQKNTIQQKFEALKHRITKNIDEQEFMTARERIESQRRSYQEKIEKYKNIELSERIAYQSILLTGATGYLGIHLLEELLNNCKAHIYLLVRGKSHEEAEQRLLGKIKFYFNETLYEVNRWRIHIVNGDIASDRFGLSVKEYSHLAEEIDCIINSAAFVKHYGFYKDFLQVNVEGVRRLIEFTFTGKKKDLNHISTISTGSGKINGRKFPLFTEFDHDLDPNIDNHYLQTKIMGERLIEEAREKGLNASIFRVGNLVFQSGTGKFQENIEDNAFYSLLRSFIKIGIMVESDEPTLDFSFIDQTSKTFALLYDRETLRGETHHLLNPNKVSLNRLAGISSEIGEYLRSVPVDEFLDILQKNYENPDRRKYIEKIILHTNLLSESDGTFIKTVSEKTDLILSRMGFYWPRLNKNHVEKMVSYCKEVGFI